MDTTAGTKGLTDALVGAFKPFLDTVKKLKDAVGTLAQSVRQGAPANGPGGPASGPGLGNMAQGLSALVSGVMGALGTAQQLLGTLTQFVEALNPNVVEAFGQALRDLQATIGYAFEPIFTIATTLFQRIAGIVLPLMEQLRPVITQLAENSAKNLIQQITVLVGVLQALMPLINAIVSVVNATQALARILITLATATNPLFIALRLLQPAFDALAKVGQMLSTVFDSMGEVINAVSLIYTTLITTLQQFLIGLFGGVDFADAMKKFKSAINDAIKGLVLFVSKLALLFGMDTFVANLMKALEPKQGLAAAGQTSIQGLEAISKALLVSAAKSGPGGQSALTEEDWRADTLRQLRALANDPDRRMRILEEFRTLLEQIRDFLRNPLGNAPQPFKDLHSDLDSRARSVPGVAPLADLFNNLRGRL